MKKSISVLIGGLALAVAGAAVAGDHKHGEHKAKMEAKLAEKFAAMDADGSGAVSQAEYLAYKAAKAEESWAKLSDGASEVTLDDVKAKHKAKMAEKKKMKEKKKDY